MEWRGLIVECSIKILFKSLIIIWFVFAVQSTKAMFQEVSTTNLENNLENYLNGKTLRIKKLEQEKKDLQKLYDENNKKQQDEFIKIKTMLQQEHTEALKKLEEEKRLLVENQEKLKKIEDEKKLLIIELEEKLKRLEQEKSVLEESLKLAEVKNKQDLQEHVEALKKLEDEKKLLITGLEEKLKRLEQEKKDLQKLYDENNKIKQDELTKAKTDLQEREEALKKSEAFKARVKYWSKVALFTGLAVTAVAAVIGVIAWRRSGMTVDRLKNTYAVFMGRNPFASSLPIVTIPIRSQPIASIVQKKNFWDWATCPDCRHHA